MDAILEYLTLKITAREFLNRVMHEDAVYDRIQSKIPQSRFAYDEEWKGSPVCAEAFQYDDLTCDGRFLPDTIHWCVHSVARQHIK